MGLDTTSVKFVSAAKSFGVDFKSTLMIGRQDFTPDESALQHIFSIHGIKTSAKTILQENKYGESFFSLLGAKKVLSLDYSAYEGADILHDLNVPIPKDLHEQFSVVYDGGSLEHVFNIPQALKNCMEMVQIGGHFLQVTNANNYMGHGFWQFSPELLFRVFSPSNGFEIDAILMHDGADWYHVSDPEDVQCRVRLCNNFPTYILCVARRISDSKIFTKPPMQSDYTTLWNKKTKEARVTQGSENNYHKSIKNHMSSFLRKYVPEPVKYTIRIVRRLDRSLPFNKPYYKKISEDKLLKGILK